MIEIFEVKTKKDLKKFIKFPLSLYKKDPNYVPPLILDELDMFNPKKNGAFEHSKARCWIAINNGKIVGRIAAIWNKAYNKKTNKKQMRFSRYDVIDDFEVSKALFDTLKKFAKECKLNEIVGPMGFSDVDYEGLLVEGFDTPSMCITMHNFPYYKEHLIKLGFIKEIDWLEYRIQLPEKVDERLDVIAQKILESRDFEIRRFKNSKEMQPTVHEAILLMNEVYSHLYGYVPQNEQQIKEIQAKFKMVLNPRFVFTVINKKNDELIGYGLIAPNLSKPFKKCWGRLLPFGIFHLLRGIKKFDTVDLYSIGVKKEYQNTGVNAIILNEGIKACVAHKVRFAETGPELEINNEVQAQWKNYAREQHKRRRLFIKKID